MDSVSSKDFATKLAYAVGTSGEYLPTEEDIMKSPALIAISEDKESRHKLLKKLQLDVRLRKGVRTRDHQIMLTAIKRASAKHPTYKLKYKEAIIIDDYSSALTRSLY